MNLVIQVLSASALLLSGTSGEKVAFKRTYTANETATYSMSLKGEAQGFEILGEAEIEYKVTEVSEGIAKVARNPLKFSVQIDGEVMPGMDISPDSCKMDAFGMPDSLSSEGAEWAYTIVAFAGFVANQEVETAQDFKVNWKGKDNGSTVTGTGKLIAVEELEGRKVAKVKYELEVVPNGEEVPGLATFESTYDLGTGQLVRSKGSLSIENEVQLSFEIKRAKKNSGSES